MLLAVSSGVAQETNDNSLTLFIEGVKVKGKDIPTVLANIANSYGIPIGLELPFHRSLVGKKVKSNKPERREGGLIIPKDGTLREVLNELLSLDSKYSWKIEAGVINVAPLLDRDLFITDILDTRVELFEFEERPGVMSVGDSLVKTREVKSKLENHNIQPLQFYYANDLITSSNSNPHLSHRFVRTSVRDVLNWIVKKGTHKFWMVARWGNKNSFVTIITS